MIIGTSVYVRANYIYLVKSLYFSKDFAYFHNK